MPGCGEPCDPAALQHHVKLHHAKELTGNVCDMCGAARNNRSELVKHKKSHDPNVKFSCKRCGSECNTNAELQNHKRAAHPRPRLFCTEPLIEACGADSRARDGPALPGGKERGFTRAEAVKRHVDTFHRGIKFRCDYPGCENEYTQATHLSQHKKKTNH